MHSHNFFADLIIAAPSLSVLGEGVNFNNFIKFLITMGSNRY